MEPTTETIMKIYRKLISEELKKMSTENDKIKIEISKNIIFESMVILDHLLETENNS